MPPAIGAVAGLLGFAIGGGFAAAAGTISIFGLSLGLMECISLGAAIGSLFVSNKMDLSAGSTPNYAFGPHSNTKSQLLPIPIVYGTCRVSGNIFLQRFYDDSKQEMDLFVGLSEGTVGNIYDVYVDDNNMTSPFAGKNVKYQKRVQEKDEEDGGYSVSWEDVTEGEYNTLADYDRRILGEDGAREEQKLKDCECRVHFGDPGQGVDPLSLGELNYGNTAFVALHLKLQDGISSNPVITSMVDGIKVRTSVESADKHFTRNPAWIIYDFMTNTRYGLGIPEKYIDIYSIEEVALYCDTLINGNPRYTLDLIIDSQKPGIDHLSDMLACFNGYIICDSKIRLRAEKEENVSFILTEDNIIQNSFQWWQKADEECYNRVTLSWIDPGQGYESVTSVYQDEADIKARGIVEQSYTMRGITRKEQADRIGTEFLNKARKVRNLCSLGVSIKDSGIEIGDVGRIRFPLYTGWEDKIVRVISSKEDGSDEIQLTCIEYQGDIYNGPVIDGGTTENYPVRVSEDITELRLNGSGYIETDGRYVPGVYATWRLPTKFACMSILVSYRLADKQGDNPPTFSSKFTELPKINGDSTYLDITTGIKSQYYVEVKVQGVKSDGSKSVGDSAICYVYRDTIAPDKPTSLTAEGWFGNIILDWVLPTDPDLSHVEVWECVSDDRDKAVLVGEVKGNSYTRYTSSFQGRYYWVRAVDYSGNKSEWNALAGTFGYSEQEKHEDLMEVLLRKNPWLSDAMKDIQSGLTQDVEKLAETILSANATLSEHTDDLKKGIAIAKEELTTTIEEGLYAEAQKRLELASALNENTAALQQEQTARVDADSALSSSIETLVTSVGDNTAAIQESKESIDGIQAKWALKVDVNGKVAGMELIGTEESSAMIFNVDSFLVGNSDNPVFAIGVVDGVQRISMRNVYIQDASISTIKIQENAVVSYTVISGGASPELGSGSWHELGRLIIPSCVAGRPLSINWANIYFDKESSANLGVWISLNNSSWTLLREYVLCTNTGINGRSVSFSTNIHYTPNSNSTLYFKFAVRTTGGDPNCYPYAYIQEWNATAFHYKR
ncbi:MAG: phage tail protein [Synergistaceae bacterium]